MQMWLAFLLNRTGRTLNVKAFVLYLDKVRYPPKSSRESCFGQDVMKCAYNSNCVNNVCFYLYVDLLAYETYSELSAARYWRDHRVAEQLFHRKSPSPIVEREFIFFYDAITRYRASGHLLWKIDCISNWFGKNYPNLTRSKIWSLCCSGTAVV